MYCLECKSGGQAQCENPQCTNDVESGFRTCKKCWQANKFRVPDMPNTASTNAADMAVDPHHQRRVSVALTCEAGIDEDE